MNRVRVLSSTALLTFVAATAFAADPVGTWDLETRVKVTVCARGRCQSQRETGRSIISLAPDGTFTSPDALAGCDLPDEEGTWTAGKRGRYVLRPTNVPELVAAIKECLGVSGLTLTGRFVSVLKPSADDTSAKGHLTFIGRGRYRGVPFTARAVARYVGTRLQDTAGGVAVGQSAVGMGGVLDVVGRTLP